MSDPNEEAAYSSLDSKSECIILRFPTASSDDTQEYIEDAEKNLCGTSVGKKLRLPAVSNFDLGEPVLFKPTSKSPIAPADFIIRKGMNTLFIQPEKSN